MWGSLQDIRWDSPPTPWFVLPQVRNSAPTILMHFSFYISSWTPNTCQPKPFRPVRHAKSNPLKELPVWCRDADLTLVFVRRDERSDGALLVWDEQGRSHSFLCAVGRCCLHDCLASPSFCQYCSFDFTLALWAMIAFSVCYVDMCLALLHVIFFQTTL